jgi:carbon storage regulator
MLVLSRRIGEKIVIEDDIVLTVVRVQGDKVRLGIEAPREIPVHRKEIYEKLRQARNAAAQAADQPVTTDPSGDEPRSDREDSAHRTS